jgi:CCR4-NOT complex subunit CAF16
MPLSPSDSPAVDVRGLDFRYRGDQRLVLRDLSLTVGHGARCLVIGANGAGKTTLLEVLGGRHMVPEDKVRVLDRPAFHDTSLVARVAYIGGAFPFDVDCPVRDILAGQPPHDPERLETLLEVLGVDVSWRMHRVSDGQRRRVQILLHLLVPHELLLLDEITTDLDLVARADLLRFLKRDCDARGATILYATHILDGLDDWATHIAFMDGGRIRLFDRLENIRELRDLREAHVSSPLYRLVERWLRD